MVESSGGGARHGGAPSGASFLQNQHNAMGFKSQHFGRNKSKPVEVDALVLIKIMRHCRDYFPTPVNGLLLGLDQSDTLEVTDCFGLQNKQDLWNQLFRQRTNAKEVDEKVHIEDHRYQMKMLEQLNVVNADCCNVGWYQTLQFNDLKDPSIVDGLCEHQALIHDAICIGFDPQLAYLGAEAFKAFRVTDEVLKCRKEENGDASVYNRLKGKEILVEAPLYVRNSLLVQSFLYDWMCSSKTLQDAGEFTALEEGDRGDYVQKSLGFIVGCLDDLQQEQEKLMKYQKESVRQYQKQKELAERRRLENEQRRLRNEELLPEIPVTLKKGGTPSQVPTLLMSNHVGRVSEKLSRVIGDSICRSALVYKEMTPP